MNKTVSNNIIRTFNNAALIDLFEKNGYDEFAEILADKRLNGENLLVLTKFEIQKWRLPPTTTDKLWLCLIKLRNNPEIFLNIPEPSPSLAMNKIPYCTTNNSGNKAFASVRKFPKLNPSESCPHRLKPPPLLKKPPMKAPSQQAPSNDEYLIMDKNVPMKKENPRKSDGQNIYDENGYLLPMANLRKRPEVVENDYEAPPRAPPSIIKGAKTRSVKVKPSIAISERAPMVLPRDFSNDDYISDSEIPQAQKRCGNVQKTMPPERPKNLPVLNIPENVEIGGRKSPLGERPPLRSRAVSRIEKSPINSRKLPPNSYENAKIQSKPEPSAMSGIKNWFKKLQVVDKPHYVNHDIIKNQEALNEFSGFKPKHQGMPSDIQLRQLPSTPDYDDESSNMKNLTQGVQYYEDEETTDEIYTNLPPAVVETLVENDQCEDKIYKNFTAEVVPKKPTEKTATFQDILARQLKNALELKGSSSSLARDNENSQENDDKVGAIKKIAPPPLPTPKPVEIDAGDVSDDLEDYDAPIFNLNNDPFYRKTDRKGANLLLHGLEDGAFLFRNCYHKEGVFLTLTVKYKPKCFNLCIELTRNRKIRCEPQIGITSPEFATLEEFVTYFTEHPLVMYHKDSKKVVEIYLKKSLPRDRF